MTPLKLGLIATSPAQLSALKEVVQRAGQGIIAELLLSEETSQGLLDQDASAWLIAQSDENDYDDWLGACLDVISEPIIFAGDDCPAPNSKRFLPWAARLVDKVQRLQGAINLASENFSDADAEHFSSIWILAASTGGPAAVKEFLTLLPKNLDIAFIYVQHIDREFEKTLTQVMERDSFYPVETVEHGALLRNNTVAVIGAENWMELLANGTFVNLGRDWPGYYSPSADQVAASVARTFAERANLLVFTGMEDDGARASRLIKQRGGRVWVQSPETCVSPSMPESVLATGSVDYSGTIAELAAKLTQLTSPMTKWNNRNKV